MPGRLWCRGAIPGRAARRQALARFRPRASRRHASGRERTARHGRESVGMGRRAPGSAWRGGAAHSRRLMVVRLGSDASSPPAGQAPIDGSCLHRVPLRARAIAPWACERNRSCRRKRVPLAIDPSPGERSGSATGSRYATARIVAGVLGLERPRGPSASSPGCAQPARPITCAVSKSSPSRARQARPDIACGSSELVSAYFRRMAGLTLARFTTPMVHPAKRRSAISS